MRVQILNQDTESGCRCGSWLNHWDGFSRQKANFCMVVGCDGPPEVGAQVSKEGEPDRVAIVPLCRACAAKTGSLLEIVNNVNLVTINTGETCARKQASGY